MKGASQTAVLVCQGRAIAHGRYAVERFSDPTAAALLRGAELDLVNQARREEAPEGWAARTAYELAQGTAQVIVPRTVAIDDAIRARPGEQLVILGAGLDGRAWRLRGLDHSGVFEVDHPDSQDDKRERAQALADLGPQPSYVPVNFRRQELADALDAAGHRPLLTTTWVWEGVVPYLTASEVRSTVEAVASRSAAGSRLIVNYQAPSLRAKVGRLAVRAAARLGRGSSPLAGEPTRSTWRANAMAGVLGEYGFSVVSDEDLFTVAQRIGSPTTRRESLHNGRVTVADLSARSSTTSR